MVSQLYFPFSPFFSLCSPFSPFLSGTPIVAMFVQLAYIGKGRKGRKGRMMLKILFITPEEIEGTLMTVGPKPSLFLFRNNKRPIYPTTHRSFVQIPYDAPKGGNLSPLYKTAFGRSALLCALLDGNVISPGQWSSRAICELFWNYNSILYTCLNLAFLLIWSDGQTAINGQNGSLAPHRSLEIPSCISP